MGLKSKTRRPPAIGSIQNQTFSKVTFETLRKSCLSLSKYIYEKILKSYIMLHCAELNSVRS